MTAAPGQPQPKQFPANHILFKEGDAAPEFYVLISGKLAVFRNRKFVQSISGAGVFVGEMASLLNHKRSATVIVLEQAALIPIPRDTDSVFLQRQDIGEKLIESLRKRLSVTYDKAVPMWDRVMREITEMIVYEASTKQAARKNMTFDQIEAEKVAVRKMAALELGSEDFHFGKIDDFLKRLDIESEFRRNLTEKYPRFKFVDLNLVKELWKKRMPAETVDRRRHCVDLAQGLDELTDFLTSFGENDTESGTEEVNLLESVIPLARRISMLRAAAQKVLTPKEGIEGMKRLNREFDTECEEAGRHEQRTGRTFFFSEFAKRMDIGAAYIDDLRREFWSVCVKE